MINWKTITLQDLAGFVSEELRKRGINVVLVGGACVTIYSQNRYQSYDLDFVVYEDMKKVKQALKEIGFSEKNRYFFHADCKWVVEFVSSPVAVGKEIVRDFQFVRVATGTIQMLRPEDSIKDRLGSYFHWNDRQGLVQAIDIGKECKVDLEEVKKWAQEEGFQEKFLQFLSLLKKETSKND